MRKKPFLKLSETKGYKIGFKHEFVYAKTLKEKR